MSEIQQKADDLTALYAGKLASFATHCPCGACATPSAPNGIKFIVDRFEVDGDSLHIIATAESSYYYLYGQEMTEGEEGEVERLNWTINHNARIFIYPSEEAMEI